MAAFSKRPDVTLRWQWRLKLAEYEYEVVYKAGKMNLNADALSRNPLTVLPLRREVSGKVDSKEVPP